MPALRALRLCGPRVIPVLAASLRRGAGLVGWSHVALVVEAAKLKGDDMLDDPLLAHAIDGRVADAANALLALPDTEPLAGSEPLAVCRPDVCHFILPSNADIGRRFSAGM